VTQFGCSVFNERWIVLRPKRRLTLRAALPFCLALRDAVMKHGPQPSPEWLSGHASGGKPSQRPHVAFLPLADVGHFHAHGLILGFAVVLPREVPEMARWQCIGACRAISRLSCGAAGHCDVEVLTGQPERAALASFTWNRPARLWASATPFVFDRDPKKDPFGPAAEEVVRQACLRVGLPGPVTVSVTPTSPLLAVPMSWEFPARQTPGKQRRRHVHVQVTFAEPVRGPVLIGAGRYYGYGLLRPMPNTTEPPAVL
jgi:CRISPR-associated protein Csb2